MANENNNNNRGMMHTAKIATRAGMAGVILGAVGTAVLLLSDRQIRKIATQKADELKSTAGKWGQQTYKNIQSTAKDTADDVSQNISEAKSKQEKTQNDTKEKLTRSVH